jgi:hypothetical protein
MEIRTTNLRRRQGGYNGDRLPVWTPRTNISWEDTLSSNDEISDGGDITPAQGVDVVIGMLRIHNAAMLAQLDAMQTIVRD